MKYYLYLLLLLFSNNFYAQVYDNKVNVSKLKKGYVTVVQFGIASLKKYGNLENIFYGDWGKDSLDTENVSKIAKMKLKEAELSIIRMSKRHILTDSLGKNLSILTESDLFNYMEEANYEFLKKEAPISMGISDYSLIAIGFTFKRRR